MTNLLNAQQTRFGIGVSLLIICLPIILLAIIIWLIVKAAKGHFKYKKPFKCFKENQNPPCELK